MTTMCIVIHSTSLPHDEPEASPAFDRGTRGFEVRNDVEYSAVRGIAVGPPCQPSTSIVLQSPDNARTAGIGSATRPATTSPEAEPGADGLNGGPRHKSPFEAIGLSIFGRRAVGQTIATRPTISGVTMTNSSTEGITTVPHRISDLATAQEALRNG